MAIPTPAALVITPQSALTAPVAMTAVQLKQALANCNRAWADYRPPLVSVAPHMALSAALATTRIIVPVEVSADSLDYLTRWAVYCDSACSLAWSVEVDDGGGFAVVDNGIKVFGAGGVQRWDGAAAQFWGVPPIAVVRVRYTVTPDAGSALIHHVLTYPDPGGVTAGIRASGFRPYDDGLLAGVSPPINTEHLRRAWRNAALLLRDRKPMVLSFAQIATGTAYLRCSGVSVASSLIVGRAVVRMPGQSGLQTLYFHALGEVSAGANTDLILVRQVATSTGKPMAQIKLDADGVEDGATLLVYLEGDGLAASVTLEIEVLWTATAGVSNETTLRYLCAYWRPA